MQTKQKILIIVGPTSSGKSALAVELARECSGEVISADSRQVYRGLNIGTGKITKREMKGVRHHLLNEVSPHRTFTADDFVKRGRTVIEDIVSRGNLPIIAGGTGFYVDTLVGRIVVPNVPPDPTLRAQLEKKSVDQLLRMLQTSDPRRAKTIEPQNKRRLIRALEIAAALGHVPPNMDTPCPYFDAVWIGIAPRAEELRKKIAGRLRARMKSGMVAEARRLHAAGLSYGRMHELGLEYRSLASLLQGKITKAHMLEELERAIWKYAKRQIVYWKRNQHIRWFTKPDVRRISKAVRPWLT